MSKKLAIFKTGIAAIVLQFLPLLLFAQGAGSGDRGTLLTTASHNGRVNKGNAAPLSRVSMLGAYHPEDVRIKKVPRSIHAKADGSVDTVEPQPIMKIKGGPLLWGVIEYSSAWKDMPEDSQPTGVYSILATSPNANKPLLLTGHNGPNGGGVFYDNAFHYVNYSIMYETAIITYTYDYDVTTWQQNNYAQYGSDNSIIATDLTYDPTTQKVYGYFYNPLDNEEPMRFGTITYDQYGASVNSISQEDTVFICLAANNEGQLYGISWGGGLWKIDKVTGEKTLVDYTGVRPSSFRQSATFDKSTGKMYWTAFREDYTSGLYEVNTDNGVASLVAEIPDSMEISCLYIPDPEAPDGAPAAVSDLSVSFDNGSTTGACMFDMPSETYGGEPLEGALNYSIVVNGSVVMQGEAMPSERVDETITVENGQCDIYVVTDNASGKSPVSNKLSMWVGYDEPLSPSNVQLAIDGQSGKASLSWDAPANGIHDGYFDAASLKYDVVRFPGKVVVASDMSETCFSETLPVQQLTSYYYEVTAKNGTVQSQPANSNKQAYGSAFEPPFVDDFSTEDTYGLYTIINSNGDDKTWADSYMCFSYFYSWSNGADDWLLTPPVSLKAGKTYRFSFDVKGSSTYDAEKYAVSYGMGTDPSSYVEIVPVKELKTSSYITEENDVTVEADGEYRFGIHALSDAYKGILSVTNIKIEPLAEVSAPDSVVNLKLTPAPKGEMKTTVEFTTPHNDLQGNALSQIDKVEVYRNGESLIKTFDNPSVAQALSFEDVSPVNGYNHYSVVAYGSAGKGKMVTDSVYVGMDIPSQPQDVKIVDNGNGLTVTWKAPSETGVNNGYVNAAELSYNVYDSNGEVVLRGVKGTTHSIVVNLEAATSVTYYGVSAFNDAGEGAVCVSNYLATGVPVQLPYEESFAKGGTTKTLWWSYGSNPNNAFSFSPDISSDHDFGCAYWFGIEPGDYAYLNSGRITAKNTANPMLFFSYYAVPGKHMSITVNAELPNTDAVQLLSCDYSGMQGDEGWRKAAVKLPESVRNADYFMLGFLAKSDENAVNMYIDDIVMRDVMSNDLMITGIASPSSVTAGDSVNVKVAVVNNGAMDSGDFTVRLYAGDEEADSKSFDMLEFNSGQQVSLCYAPGQTEAGSIDLYAAVDYLKDENQANNVSEKVEIGIVAPVYPAVDNLSAQAEGNDVVLKWSKPISNANVVTDSFESYDMWSVDKIGDWTVFDGDKGETNSYTSMYYPNIGEKFAYLVFNNKYATMDVSQQPVFTPYYGTQALTAFATVHDYENPVPTDDWLITPQLSGQPQTVSFYIKSFTTYAEDFYAYYSMEEADTASLRKNRLAFEKFGAGYDWQRYEYELPAGAKYFGLCYTSNLSGIMIDDFTYEGLPLEVVGYNIYKDNALVGFVEEGTCSHKDIAAAGDNHSYAVTVVYNVGESACSNVVDYTASGIARTLKDDRDADLYTLDGVMVKSNKANMQSGFRKGVYILGDKKVVVK